MDFEERKKREPFGEDFGEKNRRRGEPRLVEQDDRNRRVFDQGESGWSEALPGVEPKLSSQLERRVQIGFLLGIVMLALIGVLAYRSVVRLRADAAWVDHTHQVISALREVMATTTDAETSARGFVITGDENFLAPLIAASGRVSGEVRTVRLLTADNAVQQKNMDVLEPLVSARINNIVKLLEVRRRGGFAEAEQEVASARGKAIQDKIRALIEKMERLEDGYLQQREEVAANSAKWTKTLVIGTGGLALCFIAIGMALLQRDFAGARQAEAELSQFTEQLEVRVWERTGELRAALGRLSESEELLSVTLSSIGDGVVTTDAQGLVTFLNGEAERLTGWRNEDAAGRPLKQVFQVVNEETREPLEDPAEKVLRLGKPVALANHTTLLARGGVETPIADSGSPIQDAEGKILGVVLVFRDCLTQRQSERHRQELLISQDHFRMLVSGVKDYAIFMLDLKGKVTTWNPGAERILEWRGGEIIGQDFWRFQGTDPSAQEKTQAELKRASAEGSYETEGWRFRKDGARFWASVVITPLRDEAGRDYGFATIMRDMTERRRIEQAIRDDEARLSAIVGSAMDAIITVNEQQVITLFNPAAEKMFRCSAGEAIGRSLERFVPHRFRAAHAGHIKKFGETHVTRRKMSSEATALFGLRVDGEEFPIEASISHVEFGSEKLFTVILRDVTERNKQEEEMRRQASILNQAIVMGRDMEGRMVLWTEGAEKFYGFERKHVIGTHFHSLLHTQFPMPLPQIEEALYRDGMWQGEVVHQRSDGSYVAVASRWILHRDAEGKPEQIVAMNQDMTGLKKAQASQLRSQKLESLGTLAGGIAHDFNNILLAITGNAKMAIADLPAEHPVQESLRQIAKAGVRATDLVRRIVAFSRPAEQQREVQEVRPVVEDALKLVRATLPANIVIKTEFGEQLPEVVLNEPQIHQAIVNLATNAAWAIGDREGKIEVGLEEVEIGAADVGLAPGLREGTWVRLRVADNGCGMDGATLARMYDPFFTTKPAGLGTGLGLSVVHGIVTNHEGAVVAHSEVGRGTEFCLYFPAALEKVPEVPAVEQTNAERVRTEHVMYVDDEESLVLLAKRLLTRLGYRVTGFTDAKEALETFRARPKAFDAVVTDLSMPGIFGLDFAQEILAARPEMLVMITSGYVRQQDQERAHGMGLPDIILKPTTVDELAKKLDEVLQERAKVKVS